MAAYDLPAIPGELVKWNGVDPADPPEGLKWGTLSGWQEPPAIGARVVIRVNNLGSGVVRSYFTEYDWLGVRVDLDNPPEWHRKQNPGRGYALVFGAELGSPTL